MCTPAFNCDVCHHLKCCCLPCAATAAGGRWIMVRHEVPVLLLMFAGPSSTAVSYGIALLWDLKYMIIVTSRFNRRISSSSSFCLSSDPLHCAALTDHCSLLQNAVSSTASHLLRLEKMLHCVAAQPTTSALKCRELTNGKLLTSALLPGMEGDHYSSLQ